MDINKDDEQQSHLVNTEFSTHSNHSERTDHEEYDSEGYYDDDPYNNGDDISRSVSFFDDDWRRVASEDWSNATSGDDWMSVESDVEENYFPDEYDDSLSDTSYESSRHSDREDTSTIDLTSLEAVQGLLKSLLQDIETLVSYPNEKENVLAQSDYILGKASSYVMQYETDKTCLDLLSSIQKSAEKITSLESVRGMLENIKTLVLDPNKNDKVFHNSNDILDKVMDYASWYSADAVCKVLRLEIEGAVEQQMLEGTLAQLESIKTFVSDSKNYQEVYKKFDNILLEASEHASKFPENENCHKLISDIQIAVGNRRVEGVQGQLKDMLMSISDPSGHEEVFKSSNDILEEAKGNALQYPENEICQELLLNIQEKIAKIISPEGMQELLQEIDTFVSESSNFREVLSSSSELLDKAKAYALSHNNDEKCQGLLLKIQKRIAYCHEESIPKDLTSVVVVRDLLQKMKAGISNPDNQKKILEGADTILHGAKVYASFHPDDQQCQDLSREIEKTLIAKRVSVNLLPEVLVTLVIVEKALKTLDIIVKSGVESIKADPEFEALEDSMNSLGNIVDSNNEQGGMPYSSNSSEELTSAERVGQMQKFLCLAKDRLHKIKDQLELHQYKHTVPTDKEYQNMANISSPVRTIVDNIAYQTNQESLLDEKSFFKGFNESLILNDEKIAEIQSKYSAEASRIVIRVAFTVDQILGREDNNDCILEHLDREINKMLKAAEQVSWDKSSNFDNSHIAEGYDIQVMEALSEALSVRNTYIQNNYPSLNNPSNVTFVAQHGYLSSLNFVGLHDNNLNNKESYAQDKSHALYRFYEIIQKITLAVKAILEHCSKLLSTKAEKSSAPVVNVQFITSITSKSVNTLFEHERAKSLDGSITPKKENSSSRNSI